MQALPFSHPADPHVDTPRRVVVIAIAPAQVLDVAGPLEVFSQASRLRGARQRGSKAGVLCLPAYRPELVVVTRPGEPTTTCGGLALAGGRTLEQAMGDPAPVDTLLVAGGEGARNRCREEALLGGIRHLAARSRRVVSVCTGAFPLAAAGLLDGRRAVTHWRWCARLAREFPAVRVDPDPIFIQDGNTWTSAGVTAGMDLTLALVEADLGHGLALAIARELVLFLRRPGGQSQFSATLVAQGEEGAGAWDGLHAWMADHLGEPLTVEALAARVRLSPRQFARVFVRRFGLGPAKRVEQLRVEAARRRLESSAAETVSAVAARCGFGSEETMRRAFLRVLRVPPAHYRARFAQPPPGVPPSPSLCPTI